MSSNPGDSRSAVSAARWYLDPNCVERRFYGVFAGGAAKGVAYPGALLAMRDTKCWFHSVAGASSGAITAVLVASGMPPERAMECTLKSLDVLSVRPIKGLRRLHSGKGYYPSEALIDWLETLLVQQVETLQKRSKKDKVTFTELYTASGIGLNVVATNLSRQEQIVFNRHRTGSCSVTDATIASASIPFAFESRLLEMVEDDGTKRHHTIVDGGVWANFPMFVYADSTFRKFDGHEPVEIPEHDILGFMLTEDTPRSTDPKSGSFDFNAAELRAYEWSRKSSLTVPARLGLVCRSMAPLVAMLKCFTGALDLTQPIDRGRWPRLQNRCNNDLADSISHSFGAFSPILAGVTILIGLLVASGVAIAAAFDWAAALPHWGSILVYVAVLLFALYLVPVTLLTFVGVVSGYLLLRAARRALYGLIVTYAAVSGARPWDRERNNVIELLTDPRIGPVSFVVAKDLHVAASERAYKTTTARLREILKGSPQ